jgi:primase-polymerase (primpol)-like protein
LIAISRKHELERAPTRPEFLRVNPEGIPAELRDLPQWVVWAYESRQSKTGEHRWTKVPRTAEGKAASTTNASTWSIFDAALGFHRAMPHTCGVGFVFSPNDPYCGVDLDDARDLATGRVLEWAQPIVDLLDSYTEVSPSGTGLKVILRGVLKIHSHKKRFGGGEVEVYDRARFFALTGVQP